MLFSYVVISVVGLVIVLVLGMWWVCMLVLGVGGFVLVLLIS